MDERAVVAAILNDRSAYDKLTGRLDPGSFGEQARLVIKAAVDFYKKDPRATAVDRSVVESQITRMFASKKHADAVVAYLDDLPEEVSTINVATEYRQLRRYSVGLELAARLGAGQADQETDRLLEKYRALGVEQQGESPRPSIDQLFERIGKDKRMRLGLARINEEIRGGALRGDHIVIFGRPNAFKSMLAVHIASTFLRQGVRVLYLCNEESRERYIPRFLSRLSGMTWGIWN